MWEGVLKQIGTRYRHCHLDNFEVYDDNQQDALQTVKHYATKLAAEFAAGNGIVLFGPVGTGKDHLLTWMMRAAVLDHGFEVRWLNGMTLFGDVRDAMDGDKKEASFVGELSRPAILAISDPVPPWGTLTQFQSTLLFRVIDQRYRNCRPTWCTMNVAHSEEAEARMGTSIVSRIKHGAVAVYCNWPDYRSRKRKEVSANV